MLPLVIVLICVYIAFPRQCKNVLVRILKRKDFVVVLMKKANSDVIEKWLVVPPHDKMTKIKKGLYNLNATFKAGSRAGKDYFLCDENDSIPRLPEKGSHEEIIFEFLLNQSTSHLLSTPKIKFGSYDTKQIIFQAHEMQTTLQNRIAEVLFTKQKDQTFYILVAIIVLVSFLAWYEARMISEMKPLVEKLASVDYAALDNLTKNTLR